jgi:hypothetical protein
MFDIQISQSVQLLFGYSIFTLIIINLSRLLKEENKLRLRDKRSRERRKNLLLLSSSLQKLKLTRFKLWLRE